MGVLDMGGSSTQVRPAPHTKQLRARVSKGRLRARVSKGRLRARVEASTSPSVAFPSVLACPNKLPLACEREFRISNTPRRLPQGTPWAEPEPEPEAGVD